MALLIKLSASQTPTIKVTYNSKSCIFNYSDLNVKNLKSQFNISDLEFLEDLSELSFYPSMSGSFAPFISSEVNVRQRPPAKTPTVIYPTESKFLFNTGPWTPQNIAMCIGYYLGGKHIRATFLNFKDLSAINQKRKINKVYLRLIGNWQESYSPTQVFTHRIESEWQGIINWDQHPAIREQPDSFRILSVVLETPFLWDVTNIVLEWTTGILPNYGIALKTNYTPGIPSGKNFYGHNSIKKPCLLVYYAD